MQHVAAEKKFKIALSTSCCTAGARWALSQSPSIGLLVGVRPSAAVARPWYPQMIEYVYRLFPKVDYGVLYSVNGLLPALRITSCRAQMAFRNIAHQLRACKVHAK